MPLGTLDRTAPPLFNQGPSALSKLMFFSALALFLMVADARFNIVQPLRAAIGAVLYPIQWLALQAGAARDGRRPLPRGPADRAGQARRTPARRSRCSPNAPARPTRWRRRTRGCARCSSCARPRRRRAARPRCCTTPPIPTPASWSSTRASTNGIAAGSPVIDEHGRAGPGHAGAALQQRDHAGDRPRPVHPRAERAHRRAQRGVRRRQRRTAAGWSCASWRPTPIVQEGDLLTTSGVDGVYPPGLPVAKIDRIERRADSAFARIHCVPLAPVTAARYVLVLAPTGVQAPKPVPAAPAAAATSKKKGDKPAPSPRSRADGKKEGRNPMIMRPGQQQLLLPVNPLFMWGSLHRGAAASTCCRWAAPPGCPTSWRW